MYEGLKALNDKEFLPQKRSQLSIEKLKREYNELDDVPPSATDSHCSTLDRTRLIIACHMGSIVYNGVFNLKPQIMKEFNLNEDELAATVNWYTYYGLIEAFKHSDYDLWALTHGGWPQYNGFYLVQHDADGCSRIFRRLQILSKSEKVSPHIRVGTVVLPYVWYIGISPHAVAKLNVAMDELLQLNDGNIKHAYWQSLGGAFISWGAYSRGDMQLAEVYCDRILKIRVDSEAIDDQKASVFMWAYYAGVCIKFMTWQTEQFRNIFSKMYSLSSLYPNAIGKYPSGGPDRGCKRMMAMFAIEDGDWDSAESLLEADLIDGREKYIVEAGFSHCELQFQFQVVPFAKVYMHKVECGEDTTAYERGLKAIRTTLERFAEVLPGTHRCAGIVYVAGISYILRDRPFSEMLKKMEDALAYATELACLPFDILVLEQEIAKWKGDGNKFKEVYNKFIELNYTLMSKIIMKPALDEFESGKREPVDLTFVPEIVEPILSDEEKMAKIKEKLKMAMAEVKAARTSGTDEEIQIARTNAKAVKMELKALKEEIEAKSKPTIDQAKIDDLEAKIADATARAEQAFLDDDDEAEEAAGEEIKKYRAELEALTGGSIPKQKLEDAKKTDAEINKS
eukprot:g7329.t1